MPKLESYIVDVEVSVVVRTTSAGKVAEYAVVRSAGGDSASPTALEGVVGTATAAAVSASRIVTAGVENAEKRRLK